MSKTAFPHWPSTGRAVPQVLALTCRWVYFEVVARDVGLGLTLLRPLTHCPRCERWPVFQLDHECFEEGGGD